jgi:hypothetical protein
MFYYIVVIILIGILTISNRRIESEFFRSGLAFAGYDEHFSYVEGKV